MVNGGRFRTPNPPIWHVSTVLADDMAQLAELHEGYAAGDPDVSLYGTQGTPTTRALDELLLAGEGGAGVRYGPTGLAAISTAILSVVGAGDHLLVPDNAYNPVRRLSTGLLPRLGVTAEFYDPLIGAGIADLIRPETRAIWLESPGSHTFEIQDVPAIVTAARAADHRVVTIFDNTWGSPGVFAPFEHGIDISVVAITKYWGGHSDLLMGAIFATAELLPAVHDVVHQLGVTTNGADAYLAARGARTVAVRMPIHGANAVEIARRLEGHPRAGRVNHPALPSFPWHALWKRDFRGSSGLFSFELLAADGGPSDPAEAIAFSDRLAASGLFGIGYSWGGYESLVMPQPFSHAERDVRPWVGGQLIRLHIGLDPVDDQWTAIQAALDG